MTRQMIVLGNGFDTCLGLKSSYPDFFRDRFLEIFGFPLEIEDPRVDIEDLGGNEAFDLFKKYGENNNKYKITIWDFIFLFEYAQAITRGSGLKDMYNWSDIESIIKKWVSNEDAGRDYLVKFRAPGIYIIDSSDSFLNTGLAANSISMDHVAEYLNQQYYSSDGTEYALDSGFDDVIPDKTFDDVLFDDLKVFEQVFADYLNRIQSEPLESGESYQIAAQKTYNEIVRYGLDDKQKTGTINTLLSFNYTTPIRVNYQNVINEDKSLTGKSLTDVTLRVLNVHGKIGRKDEPNSNIFGIDPIIRNKKKRHLLEDPQIFKFTKPARALTNLRINLDENIFDIDAVHSNHQDIYIKFFGHSLGDADYSYFQALFDHFDIYNRDEVKLCFLYRKHNDGKDRYGYPLKDYDPSGLIEKVEKLINAYGETLDNKDHGMNLFQKLVLERRICVQAIDE
ncbi:AbiH family protein [Bifidobacterium sp. ESL0769]|uniref:AbiH family protein n=1 Tax=Bifidobacterium sp. ESL0769 TaxID=2983229 RepID=UPI0023FA3A09|nr:AbiH family protein [Bifidobacterium sp. ESL0769]WEV68126.1 AbiH family protein [Bifidobacterium sp. ESL0769]